MAQYLPVLLVSLSTNVAPDDSTLEPLPRGQVDYLSHQWEEEDVWRSWRSMTRQKNEIANGMRLENASWRTWWKQRNKLKTISPETLNWLKDSDVTWLYGPLHTALDWSPPPKPKPDPTEVGKESSVKDKLDLAQAKHKSILKHRSISQLLQSELPASPLFSPAESDEEEEDVNDANNVDDDDDIRPVRPPLLQTKSAPFVRPPSHPALRKPSPPRVLPPAMTSGRHITFNTFVEQCIAIDSPRRPALSSADFIADHGPRITNRTRSWDGRTSGRRWANADDDDDDEDVTSSSWATNDSALSSDSDDALEIYLPRSRSGSRSSSSNKSLLSISSKGASKTIAPIAPARLKTTGVGNSWAGGEWISTRDEGHVEDVHLPRTGATVNLPASAAANSLVSAFDDDDSEEGEVFTHESSYFSADVGVQFAEPLRATREPRGAEIVEIEGRPRDRSRSRSRSKSRSRSRTPSPAMLAATPSSPPNTVTSTRSGLLSPPLVPPRGRDTSVSPSTTSTSSSTSAGRGRSAMRTASSSGSSDRERSRSGSSHTSPLGSLSPEYSGVRTSGAGELVYVKWTGEDKSSPQKGSVRTTSSAEDSTSNSGSSGTTRPTVQLDDVPKPSVTPANSPVVPTRVPGFVSKAASVASSSSSSSSSTSTKSAPPTKSDPAFVTTAASTSRSIPPRLDTLNGALEEEDDVSRQRANPTPANSPIVQTRAPPRIANANANSPPLVNGLKKQPMETTAKSISPPKTRPKPPNGIDHSHSHSQMVAPTSPARATFQVGTPVMSVPPSGTGSPSASENALQRTLGAAGPPSPTSSPGSGYPNGSGNAHPDGTIVGKAVGMVTSAGAYFGLWSGTAASA